MLPYLLKLCTFVKSDTLTTLLNIILGLHFLSA